MQKETFYNHHKFMKILKVKNKIAACLNSVHVSLAIRVMYVQNAK